MTVNKNFEEAVKNIIKHYEESKIAYDIIGESHIEYYREKHHENYKKLKTYYDKNNK